jgi:predicted nucleotidyltransferase
MVKNEIAYIINKFIRELNKEGIDIIKIFLYGSYARGTERIDSDIDVAVVCKDFDIDPIEQNIKLWKIAVSVDTRIAPISFSISEFQEDFIPIISEIKNGIDLTSEIAA